MTCRYNVFWNGQQALKEAETELEKVSKDNYTARLPVYVYPAKSDLGPVLPHLDRVIEKASKAIYKHSMVFHGKEYVKTIDNAYLLMGKAYFHKQDYTQAQRTFSYILSHYPEADTYGEASVMLARTAMRQDYFASADEQLETLHYMATDKKDRKFNVLYNAAKAEYHLTAPDGDMQEAADYLHGVIDARPKREFRSRMYLILGQLYETMEQQEEAKKNFMEVIRRSSDYEMVFNAQMHLASNYDGSEASRAQIMKQFRKMLKEKRNEDYRDQIYYACSEIARIDGDDTLRKSYLARSVAAYSGNDYQRTFSALTLADLYFAENQYKKAQHYYDTATLTIPGRYPDYGKVMQKAGVLKDLVAKLDEIELQDSLQRIARMSPARRSAWVKKMIADYTEAERKAQALEAERQLAMQSAASYTNINVTSSNGKWYFYNSALVTAGQQDFMRRFGPRKLEDNWFISNRQQISFDDMASMNNPDAAADSVQYDEDGNPVKQRETDPKKEEYYLQDLPLTPGAVDSSDRIICNDLYEVGFIYQDMLHDYPRAEETFESLLSRFPDGEYSPACLYLLYLNYTRDGNPRAAECKNLILTKHAGTDYAAFVRNPDYYKELAEKEKEYERRYEQLYAAFGNRQWSTVLKTAAEVMPKCADEGLKAKYAYLEAVASGQVYGDDSLILKLTGVVSAYPQTEVAGLARIYLSNFTAGRLAQALPADTAAAARQTVRELLGEHDDGAAAAANNPFVFKNDEMHYVVLLVKSANLPITAVKSDISKFNREFFSLQHFNVSSFFVDNTRQMITIAKFADGGKATDYYGILVKNDMFRNDIADGNITAYPMSSTNYTAFYNNKPARPLYEDFFRENYLKGSEEQK